MQISLNTPLLKHNPQTKARPSFAATPMYSVKLRQILQDKSVQSVPALISKLDPRDSTDIELMRELKDVWLPRTKYFFQIHNAFDYRDPSYTIFKLEILKHGSAAERVQSLMAIDNPDNPVYPKKMIVRYLQSAPQIANNINATIRGCGELMLYAAAKITIARRLIKGMGIHADQHSFYEHIGLERERKPLGECLYSISHSNLAEFVKNIEKKYKFGQGHREAEAEKLSRFMAQRIAPADTKIVSKAARCYTEQDDLLDAFG